MHSFPTVVLYSVCARTGTCFICNIDREDFEQLNLPFKAHVREEHNMWDYVFFRMYLEEKDTIDYSGLETCCARGSRTQCPLRFPRYSCDASSPTALCAEMGVLLLLQVLRGHDPRAEDRVVPHQEGHQDRCARVPPSLERRHGASRVLLPMLTPVESLIYDCTMRCVCMFVCRITEGRNKEKKDLPGLYRRLNGLEAFIDEQAQEVRRIRRQQSDQTGALRDLKRAIDDLRGMMDGSQSGAAATTK